MSSLEPPTTAKVTLVTSKGPIELELWAKEVPQITKHFIQNCLSKRYVGKSFNKIIKDYLIQIDTINPEVSYNFTDEFHSRIKFNKKGLIAAIKETESRKNNHSIDSFFITLKETPEFNNKYIVFGKVVGESVYNLSKINESELGTNNLPMFPAKILDLRVPVKYFDDLIEENELNQQEIKQPVKKKQKKNKKSQVKLSYELEEEKPVKDFKMKSAHELLNDKRLSNKLYVEKKKEFKELKHTKLEPNAVAEQGSKIYDNEQAASDGVHNEDNKMHGTIKQRSRLKDKKSRDLDIDSDYDSNLDLSSNDEIDLNLLHKHKFVSNE